MDDVVKYYSSLVTPQNNLNVGFPMYARWFTLPSNDTSSCTTQHPISRPMRGYENAQTGTDTGTSGTFRF